jgi:hypothetical protein
MVWLRCPLVYIIAKGKLPPSKRSPKTHLLTFTRSVRLKSKPKLIYLSSFKWPVIYDADHIQEEQNDKMSCMYINMCVSKRVQQYWDCDFGAK